MKKIDEPKPLTSGWWPESGTLTQVAICLVIVATGWYLLKELAALLRPLLIAVLLCYVILPIHTWVHKGRTATQTFFIMICGALAIAFGLGIFIYGSLIQLNDQMPRLIVRLQEIVAAGRSWSLANMPPWFNHYAEDAFRAESQGAQRLQETGSSILKYTADMFIEAIIVGLYLIFLLIEARRLRIRIEGGFDNERSRQILATVQTINEGIADYLKAKAISSTILAAPVTIILLVFGVKFAMIWGLLTFFCNYIPYVGTLIGCGTPLLFTFLDLPFDWRPVAVALLLLTTHAVCASFVEPTILGKAVGLSPLIILMSLTFWGLCWGIVGMLLAVPLTSTIKIVLQNIKTTKPVAILLGNE